MGAILTRAGCFIAIILLGYILRRRGTFAKEDFKVISKIVIRITLTASIIVSFSGRTIDTSMLLLVLAGFAFGPLMMTVGYLTHRKKGSEAAAFAMLNSSGCNIGNFVLPFAQSFLSPLSVISVSLFDTGNSLICLGGAYSVADMVRKGQKNFSLMPVLRKMLQSVPLITYVVMTVLTFAHIRLPEPCIELATIIGNANPFLAMFMIGVGFELTFNREQLGAVLKILGPRYLIGIGLSVFCFLCLPIDLAYRQALAILFLSPVSSAAPAFTAEMDGDYGLASAINSFSILTSILLILTALMLIQA